MDVVLAAVLGLMVLVILRPQKLTSDVSAILLAVYCANSLLIKSCRQQQEISFMGC